jgi:hypothetical protein
MLAVLMPSTIGAASIEITVTLKAALDKTIAASDYNLSSKIKLGVNDLNTLQEQDRSWDDKIRGIHYSNEEALIIVRKQVKQVDADKLNKLEAAVNQTKTRYKPMFTLYSSMNSLFGSQANSLKAAVQLARLDIWAKEKSLQTAKDNTDEKVMKIRGKLAEIDPLKVRITAERSGITVPSQRFTAAGINFTQAVRKSDAKNTLESLTNLVSYLRQMIDRKQRIYSMERNISEIIMTARTLISSSY